MSLKVAGGGTGNRPCMHLTVPDENGRKELYT